MCSPDEICKNNKCEDVTYAETVSLEKGNHSYFESLITSHVLFLILLMMSCVPLIPIGFFLVAFKKKPYRSFLLESYNLAPSLPRLEFLYRDRYPSTSRVDMQVDHIFLLTTLSYFKQDVIKCSKLFSSF